MGKKYKKSKKVLWRRLSLNESSNKETCENGNPEDGETCSTCESENILCVSPPPQSRPQQGPLTRKPFHPNFYPGDQRRFPPQHPFEYGAGRAYSVERFSHPRYFRGGRPFCPDPRQGPPFPGPQFQGARRRPFKYFGRGGCYVNGPSPYGRDGGLRRRWSQDEGLSLENREEDDCGEDTDERGERLSQPVHTVLINNAEEYTKIQTPRQEVIFKKCCWDRKCDSVDIDFDQSHTSSSLRLENGTRDSPGDQGSITGSIEEESSAPPSGPTREEIQQQEIHHRIHGPYQDASGMFVSDHGAPPLAGVVMQQSFPGGPMISIPVHWTPFLDPGLIPGDTALTTLDPSFTHVLDPKTLTMDPAHILPVQHDANGCPVTVQVKVNANGVPIEIEPNAFTVSLNTLEPHQQEMLLNRSNNLLTGHQLPHHNAPPGFQHSHFQGYQIEENKINVSPLEQRSETCDSVSRKGDPEAISNEDCTPDSQYASMSEPSTAPTTPSGELSDHCDSNSVDSTCDSVLTSKSANTESLLQSPKESRRVSCSDSLLFSETLDNETCSCSLRSGDSYSASKHNCPSCCEDDYTHNKLSSSLKNDSDSFHHNDDVMLADSHDSSQLTLDSLSQCSTCESNTSACHDATLDSCRQSHLPSNDHSSCQVLMSDSDVLSTECNNSSNDNSSTWQSNTSSGDKASETKKKDKKLKKRRNSSIDSEYSGQNSSSKNLKPDEPTSKHQAKREAKKIKKEKKRSVKEKNKPKLSSSKMDCKTDEKISIDEDVDEAEGDVSSSRVESTSFELSSDQSCKLLEESNLDESFIDTKINVNCRVLHDEDPSFDESEENTTLLKNNINLSHNLVTIENCDPEDDEDSERENHCHIQSQEIMQNDLETKTADSSQAEVKHELSREDNGDGIPDKKSESTEDSNIPNETANNDSGTYTDGSSENQNVDENGYTCKPGYIMVPILTPYYDPAVLYGYPLVLPESSLERTYLRKKKKKFRKKYQDNQLSLPLDTEMYVGETFIATPDGYMVPVDSSQICQMHGYQYSHNMYSPGLRDDGFGSLEHSPYLPESIPEPSYQKGYYYSDHNYQPTFSRLHEVERKQIEEVLEQHPTKVEQVKTVPTTTDSADSGVSESEETSVVLNLETETAKENNNKKEENLDVKESNKTDGSSLSGNTENVRKPSLKKENSKKKNKAPKPKRAVMEIEEPDFSSFSGSTLRFKVQPESLGTVSTKNDSRRNSKQELVKETKSKNKKTKKRKTKGNLVVEESTIEVSPLSDTINLQSKRSPQISECSVTESQSSSSHISPNDKTCITDSKLQPELLVICPKCSSDTEENLIENEVKKKKNRKKKDKKKTPSKEVEIDSEVLLENCDVTKPLSIEESSNSENVEQLSEATNNLNLTDTQESIVLASLETCPPQSSIVTSEVETIVLDLSVSEESIIENCAITENLEVCVDRISIEDLEISPATADCSSLASEEEVPNLKQIVEEEIIQEDCCSPLQETSPLLNVNSLTGLGVTEAVMKWMSEVSPEKAFTLSDERRMLLLSEMFFPVEDRDSLDNEDDDVVTPTESDSKNGESNPLAATSSKKTLDTRSERVASSRVIPRRTSLKYRRSPSRDTIDDYDGESIISNLGRERLFSSSSSSSYVVTNQVEESSTLDDPRVYDPSVYSKYYQLGVDVRITPTNSTPNSSRESTLAPSLSQEDNDCEDIFDRVSSSLSQELPLLQCGTPVPSPVRDILSSESSSGIGSSLATTPIVSPAHEPSFALDAQEKFQRNYKGKEMPMSYRESSCSVM